MAADDSPRATPTSTTAAPTTATAPTAVTGGYGGYGGYGGGFGGSSYGGFGGSSYGGYGGGFGSSYGGYGGGGADGFNIRQELQIGIHGRVGRHTHVAVDYSDAARSYTGFGEKQQRIAVWYEGGEENIVKRAALRRHHA